MSMHSGLTSIVMLTCDHLGFTKQCLEQITSTRAGADYELVVIDNGSSDGTAEWLREFAASATACTVKLVCNASNLGCCRGRNQGIAGSEGEHLLFLDNDLSGFYPGWLGELAEFVCRQGSLAAAGAMLVYPGHPEVIQCAGGAVSSRGILGLHGRGVPVDAGFSEPASVQWYPTACLMVRRQAALDAGGFNEDYDPMLIGDVDFCYRLKAIGATFHYSPRPKLVHHENVTTGPWTRERRNLFIRHLHLFHRLWRNVYELEVSPPDDVFEWQHGLGSPVAQGGQSCS